MPKPWNADDEYQAKTKRPREIGIWKLSRLSFSMDMTQEEMQTVCEQALATKKQFEDWETFQRELEQRKKRNLGFKAALLALDLEAAAPAMGTTPDKVRAVMSQYAQAEDARIKELQSLWDSGTLPDKDVLGDPSQDLVDEA